MTACGCFQKIGGKPPKWMVVLMENPIQMDDLGGKTHYFWKHPLQVCFFVFSLSKLLDDLSGNSLKLEKVDKKLLMRCFSAGCFVHTKKHVHVNVDVSKTKMSNARITFG